ncbi:MIC10 [Sanghuangporus sanghuang]
MSDPAPKTSSENTIAQKYDRCLADLIVKAGLGLGVGVVASVMFFRRHTWPVALSTGFGLGAAYAVCDRSFNPARVPGTRLAVVPPPSNTSEKS